MPRRGEEACAIWGSGQSECSDQINLLSDAKLTSVDDVPIPKHADFAAAHIVSHIHIHDGRRIGGMSWDRGSSEVAIVSGVK